MKDLKVRYLIKGEKVMEKRDGLIKRERERGRKKEREERKGKGLLDDFISLPVNVALLSTKI